MPICNAERVDCDEVKLYGEKTFHAFALGFFARMYFRETKTIKHFGLIKSCRKLGLYIKETLLTPFKYIKLGQCINDTLRILFLV